MNVLTKEKLQETALKVVSDSLDWALDEKDNAYYWYISGIMDLFKELEREVGQ